MSVSPVMSPLIMTYVPSGIKKEEEDDEYKRILTLLEMLGVTPTKNKETDKLLLQTAIQQMLQNKSANGTSKDYVPFKDIMDSLNLTSSGDVDTDYDNTIDELDYRIYMASDDEEKQYYEALKSEVETSYTENQYNNSQATMFMGSTQAAYYNKFFLT